jgi:hypothetical protein
MKFDPKNVKFSISVDGEELEIESLQELESHEFDVVPQVTVKFTPTLEKYKKFYELFGNLDGPLPTGALATGGQAMDELLTKLDDKEALVEFNNYKKAKRDPMDKQEFSKVERSLVFSNQYQLVKQVNKLLAQEIRARKYPRAKDPDPVLHELKKYSTLVCSVIAYVRNKQHLHKLTLGFPSDSPKLFKCMHDLKNYVLEDVELMIGADNTMKKLQSTTFAPYLQRPVLEAMKDLVSVEPETRKKEIEETFQARRKVL